MSLHVLAVVEASTQASTILKAFHFLSGFLLHAANKVTLSASIVHSADAKAPAQPPRSQCSWRACLEGLDKDGTILMLEAKCSCSSDDCHHVAGSAIDPVGFNGLPPTSAAWGACSTPSSHACTIFRLRQVGSTATQPLDILANHLAYQHYVRLASSVLGRSPIGVWQEQKSGLLQAYR